MFKHFFAHLSDEEQSIKDDTDKIDTLVSDYRKSLEEEYHIELRRRAYEHQTDLARRAARERMIGASKELYNTHCSADVAPYCILMNCFCEEPRLAQLEPVHPFTVNDVPQAIDYSGFQGNTIMTPYRHESEYDTLVPETWTPRYIEHHPASTDDDDVRELWTSIATSSYIRCKVPLKIWQTLFGFPLPVVFGDWWITEVRTFYDGYDADVLFYTEQSCTVTFTVSAFESKIEPMSITKRGPSFIGLSKNMLTKVEEMITGSDFLQEVHTIVQAYGYTFQREL